MIVRAKKVILMEKRVLGIPGPIKISSKDMIASWSFSLQINLPIASESTIRAKSNLRMFSSVSSSLHLMYSSTAFRPFYCINISLISLLKLHKLTNADAARDVRLKFWFFIVSIRGSTRLINSIFCASSSFFTYSPPGVLPFPPGVVSCYCFYCFFLSKLNNFITYLHAASFNFSRSQLSRMYLRNWV